MDQIFILKQIFEKSREHGKYLFACFVDPEKYMTKFPGINFGRFCGSMACMVNFYSPLSHSTANRRFVFEKMASNQSHFMRALDSGKGAFCRLCFSLFR